MSYRLKTPDLDPTQAVPPLDQTRTSTPSHDAARQFAFSTIEDVTGLKLKNHGKKPLCQMPSDKKSTGKLAYRSVDKDFTTNARAELKIMVVIFTLYHFKDN